MSKGTYFSGQPVFSQVLKLIDREKVTKISKEIPESEKYVKKLDGYTHLVTMLFGFFRHYDSLRELEIEVHKFQYLGIDYVAKHALGSECAPPPRVLRSGVCSPFRSL